MASFSHPPAPPQAMSVLGKLGGRNRRFLLHQPPRLEYRDNPEHGFRWDVRSMVSGGMCGAGWRVSIEHPKPPYVCWLSCHVSVKEEAL